MLGLGNGSAQLCASGTKGLQLLRRWMSTPVQRPAWAGGRCLSCPGVLPDFLLLPAFSAGSGPSVLPVVEAGDAPCAHPGEPGLAWGC